jgi:hypothetical protein
MLIRKIKNLINNEYDNPKYKEKISIFYGSGSRYEMLLKE